MPLVHYLLITVSEQFKVSLIRREKEPETKEEEEKNLSNQILVTLNNIAGVGNTMLSFSYNQTVSIARTWVPVPMQNP